MSAATKRAHSPEIEQSAAKKKIKSEDISAFDDMKELDEFALARLRCFGVDSDALAAVASIGTPVEKEKKSRRTLLTSQEEKELRRERGELLLKLFREVPWLADSASARRAEKNQERALMWEKITEKVNKQFGDRLEYLSVDKVKKLLTYYKKKDDGSYDNIKNNLPLDDEQEQEQDQEEAAEASTVVSESRSESGDDESGPAKGLVLIEEKEEGNQQLMEFLAAMGADKNENKDKDTPHTVANSESLYQLKKDRHDFVVSQAEHYMERMCFDNSSRSAAVNAERHCMWIKITHKANEKFGDALGPLGVEQAKKLYSNCKRRRRVKAEMGIRPEDASARDLDSATPDDNNDHSSLMDEVTDFESPAATNFEELIRGLDRSVEIDELRRQLRDKDAEIDRLKKKVAEQATEYSSRVKAVVELLKVAVDKKASDDIRSYLA